MRRRVATLFPRVQSKCAKQDPFFYYRGGPQMSDLAGLWAGSIYGTNISK